jgi:syntaxin 1B/2/3
MAPLAANGGYDPSGTPDPMAILDECQRVDQAIDDLERRLQHLESSQRQFLSSGDNSASRELVREGDDIMDGYRALVQRVRKIKGKPDSGSPRNKNQVGRVDRRLKAAINSYQQKESSFRRAMQEQNARQYRIVNPAATEEEVQQAIENPQGGIFQQAVSISAPQQVTMTIVTELSRPLIASAIKPLGIRPKDARCCSPAP